MMSQNEMICIGCQKCCKWVTFTLNFYNQKQHDDMVEFYNARGFTIHEHEDCIVVMIQTDCPNLTEFGCKIYRERPLACKMYDGRKDPYMKDICGLPKEEL